MPASSTQANGQPFEDVIGGHKTNVVDWTGPASYTTGAGETIDPAPFGFVEIMFAVGSVSVSGTYRLDCQPNNAGVTVGSVQWVARYIVEATGAEYTGGAALATEKFKIWGYGV